MAKLTEKRLYAVEKQPFLEDGTATGIVKVADSGKFVVGHIVTICSDTQPNIDVKINRIIDLFTIVVGPIGKRIDCKEDISAYLTADNAGIFAREQKRPSVPEQEVERMTYDEEPIVARRVRIVDRFGNDASSAESSVSNCDPIAKLFYGVALEVRRIIEFPPGAAVGDPLKETLFYYGVAYEVIRIEEICRPATAVDLA
jgi:hypothetical protein